MQLEPELHALASEITWPPTPTLRPQLEPRRRERRRPVLAALALSLTAIAVALAVPPSRAAILRFFHLGAATVQIVEQLPPAQERPLAAGLGPTVPTATARATLQGMLLLPPLAPPPPLHLRDGIVSLLFRYHRAPVLLSEISDRGGVLVKKLAGSATHVVPIQIGRNPGLWLSGPPHVVILPSGPPRLAHHVLLWHQGQLTLRLEGRHLTETAAKTLAQTLG